jgi:salicylate hydroxylase
MSTLQEPFTVAIIGGGLAGLTFSIGLTRNGVSHKIYESAKEFSEIGAGITMGPNAITALGLIDPRLRESFDKCATYNERPEWKDSFMAARYGMESKDGVKSGSFIPQLEISGLMMRNVASGM